MNTFLFLSCALASFGSYVMTFIGLTVVLQTNGQMAYAVCAMIAVMFLALSLSTRNIFRNAKTDWLYRIMIVFWIIGFLSDIYSMWWGLYFILGNMSFEQCMEAIKWGNDFTTDPARASNGYQIQSVAILVALAFFATAPIACSYMWSRLQKELSDQKAEKCTEPKFNPLEPPRVGQQSKSQPPQNTTNSESKSSINVKWPMNDE